MNSAVVRLVVLVVLLLNQSLIAIGWNPLPYSEEVIFEFVSGAATTLVALYAWWKNNSLTKEAKRADLYLKDIRKG